VHKICTGSFEGPQGLNPEGLNLCFELFDFFCLQDALPAARANGGVGSLQMAAHRKPVLTLLSMRDILARMM
jgi:hypothetical protein